MQAAQRFWTSYFTVYDTLNQARPYQAMIRRQLEMLAPRPGDRVLDAGTGSGNFAAVLTAAGAVVTGVDFCEPAFALARQKAPSATFEFGDLTQPLRYADGAFDAVACSAVLHVMNGAEQAFAIGEMARLLRPGGRLVVTAFAEGFSAIAVYLEALRAERRARGVVAAAAHGLRYSWHTARILSYVWRIQRQHRRGAFEYVSEHSLSLMLTDAGLEPQALERTLAGQCVTVLATKA
jgi:ubiquinone/menaquinone biosynthesis C-methylase UbiE